MKILFYTLLSTAYVLTSCNQKKENAKTLLNNAQEHQPIQTNVTKEDTVYNYWELNFDTISYKKKFKYLDKNYILELKTFSLNDSLIMRVLEQKYIDFSHTIISDLKIINDDSLVTYKRINKTDFKEYLIPEFYNECNLFYTEIDSVLQNEIHLTTILSIPDTDNQWKVEYSLRFNEIYIDTLKVKDVKYFGN